MSVAVKTSPTGALGNQGNWKRRTSTDDEEERHRNTKRARFSHYFILESESPPPTDEDEESIYTIQGEETEFARDTSDTSTHSWLSSSEDNTVAVQVEIQELREGEYDLDSAVDKSLDDASSCSEPQDCVISFIQQYSNSEELADASDESRCSFDSEVRRANNVTCVQCETPKNSIFPYCTKCYQVRKLGFPRVRPRRKQRVQKEKRKRATHEKATFVTSSQEFSQMDSGIGSSQDMDKQISSSQETESMVFSSQSSDISTVTMVTASSTLTTTATTSTCMVGSEMDSGLTPTEYDTDDRSVSPDNATGGVHQGKDQAGEQGVKSDEEEDHASLMNRISKELAARAERKGNVAATSKTNPDSAQNDDRMCLSCTVKPINGIFAHGGTAHTFFCYSCAQKILKNNGGRCPICNRMGTKVLMNFSR